MISNLLIVFSIASCAGLQWVQSSSEAEFVRSLVNDYSPLLVVSFLETRINYNKEMFRKIKNLTANLDQSRRDMFDLTEKFHDVLSNQLTALKDSGYFETNGKDKVKYYAEQFIQQNELYPIITGAYGAVKVPITPDDLLNQLYIKSIPELSSETQSLIQSYLADIEAKEFNVDNNLVQKLLTLMTKQKLQSLLNQRYSSNDQIEQNIKKLKMIVDYFYSQYNQLTKINQNIDDNESKSLI